MMQRARHEQDISSVNTEGVMESLKTTDRVRRSTQTIAPTRLSLASGWNVADQL